MSNHNYYTASAGEWTHELLKAAVARPGFEIKIPAKFYGNVAVKSLKLRYYYGKRWLLDNHPDKEKLREQFAQTKDRVRGDNLVLTYHADAAPLFVVGTNPVRVETETNEDIDVIQQTDPDVYMRIKTGHLQKDWPELLAKYLKEGAAGTRKYFYAKFTEEQKELVDRLQKQLTSHRFMFVAKDILRVITMSKAEIRDTADMGVDDLGEVPPL